MIKLARWDEYEVIATGGGEKLERWGEVVLLRPDPQVIWPAAFDLRGYKKLNAVYKRGEGYAGAWEVRTRLPKEWSVRYRDLRFLLRPQGFKHTGLFPEQAVNWDYMRKLIEGARREINVLNLFAYTGGASVACAKSGARVTHVDAAKAMVERAGENARLSETDTIKYIVDDCGKFVEREIRRGRKYEGIIMDPPSYGRGPSGEMWKLEDSLFALAKMCAGLLSDRPLFYIINSYTTGLQPAVLANILELSIGGGSTEAFELGLPTSEKGIVLPAGCTGVKTF